MTQNHFYRYLYKLAVVAALAYVFFAAALRAQIPVSNDPPQYGPYNGVFLAGGDGLKAPLAEHDSVLLADSAWTLYCWVRADEPLQNSTLLAGLGDAAEEYPRYLGADAHSVFLWMGKDNNLSAPATLTPGKWQFLAATFDGSEFRIYNNGAQIASGPLVLGSVSAEIQIAPPALPWKDGQHFGGRIASLVLVREALGADAIKRLFEQHADFSVVEFEEGSKPWPVQTHGQAGYRAPQSPDTMPVSKAPFSAPVAQPLPTAQPALVADGANSWTIAGGWRLSAAPDVTADGAAIAAPGFNVAHWLPAVVPGTVLTTLIDRGVYPDPEYGLNNLAIPESLNKQDYWYRTEIKSPEAFRGDHLTLTFEGINYKAAVWLNGHDLGDDQGRVHSRNFRRDRNLENGQGRGERAGSAGFAAAASGNSAGAIHQGRAGRKWRNHVPGRADVCRVGRLGLDSGDTRPRNGHLAAGGIESDSGSENWRCASGDDPAFARYRAARMWRSLCRSKILRTHRCMELLKASFESMRLWRRRLRCRRGRRP